MYDNNPPKPYANYSGPYIRCSSFGLAQLEKLKLLGLTGWEFEFGVGFPARLALKLETRAKLTQAQRHDVDVDRQIELRSGLLRKSPRCWE